MQQAEELIQRSTRLLDQTHKLVERSQVMLAQLQSFQAALEDLRAELLAHDGQLQDAIGQLRQLPATGTPAPPAPQPPSAFIEPQASPFPWEVSAEKEGDPSGFPTFPAVPPPAYAPDRPERRSAIRRSGNLVSILLSRDQTQEKTSSGWVLDRSLGGLGLLVDVPAQTGDVLLVRPTTSPDSPWVPVEVRYCQPLGSSWRLGCRFVGQPSWEQVRLFG